MKRWKFIPVLKVWTDNGSNLGICRRTKILKHWVDKNVDGYMTYFNRFAQYHSFTMLVLDLLNLSGLSVYHERTKIFVKVSLLWLDFVLYSRSEVEKNSHIVFSNDFVFRCSLTRLKNLEIRGREIIINLVNIMQPWKKPVLFTFSEKQPQVNEHPTVKANLEINILSPKGPHRWSF